MTDLLVLLLVLAIGIISFVFDYTYIAIGFIMVGIVYTYALMIDTAKLKEFL